MPKKQSESVVIGDLELSEEAESNESKLVGEYKPSQIDIEALANYINT